MAKKQENAKKSSKGQKHAAANKEQKNVEFGKEICPKSKEESCCR